MRQYVSHPDCRATSQIQALDRTQPGLPMKKGRCGTMTHDYKRNGTTTLFAALNIRDGTVIGRCMQRHRHQEFIRFLNATEAAMPERGRGVLRQTHQEALQRGVFCSVVELQAAINRFLAETNAAPRPFRWKKDPHKILAAVKRGHQVLDSMVPRC